ncbi:MAG: hypothetical protein HGB10_07650 [Coriobacteriia bacterium]|nr:hypothetical protein [Coriobacteriia bacterium]
MLAHVDCEMRPTWLSAACLDSDESVATTAQAVLSWVLDPGVPPWPERENYDQGIAGPADAAGEVLGADPLSRWQWEYVVEVWRDDGLLLGVYLCPTCEEDDGHAKSIALGQAILANTGGKGDSFDARTAACFIVGKQRKHPSNQEAV